jgi:signal transduction histidine kinase
MNILANAIDALEEENGEWEEGGFGKALLSPFSPPSTLSYQFPIPTIRICTEVIEGVRVLIRIADNGSGMTEDVRRRLFDPFFTTKPVGSGTGLGLAISYQIVVEKHGGQLLANSEMEKGTEFVIEIPLRQSDFSSSHSVRSA